jgi:hypothetical protein
VSSDATRKDARHRFVFLRMHPHESDFRFALAEALYEMGFDVTYIYLTKKPIIHELGSSQQTTLPRKQFFRYMRKRFGGEKRLVVFNSTDLYKPRLCLLLRLQIGGIWCFDIHDDLLYEHKGWERINAKFRQRLLVAASHIQVCAAPNLIELVPSARHLGNASSMVRIERGNIDWRKVLVMSSIDARFNFDLLRGTAELLPNMLFYVYGYISGEEIKAKLMALTDERSNVIYAGPYQNAGIPKIMADFGIMLAPYQHNHLTRYIDPLRFYHGLRSGIEVVSTSIPAVQAMSDLIHVADSPEECAARLREIAENPDARLNSPGRSFVPSWHDKARDLVQMLDAYGKASRR